MRRAIIAGRIGNEHKMVSGGFGTTDQMKLLAGDRTANDDVAFPYETVVRLPRRMHVCQWHPGNPPRFYRRGTGCWYEI